MDIRRERVKTRDQHFIWWSSANKNSHGYCETCGKWWVAL